MGSHSRFSHGARVICFGWNTGRCRAGTGLEQSVEGVNFQPEQLDEIREGGWWRPGKGYELYFSKS